MWNLHQSAGVLYTIWHWVLFLRGVQKKSENQNLPPPLVLKRCSLERSHWEGYNIGIYFPLHIYPLWCWKNKQFLQGSHLKRLAWPGQGEGALLSPGKFINIYFYFGAFWTMFKNYLYRHLDQGYMKSEGALCLCMYTIIISKWIANFGCSMFIQQ